MLFLLRFFSLLLSFIFIFYFGRTFVFKSSNCSADLGQHGEGERRNLAQDDCVILSEDCTTIDELTFFFMLLPLTVLPLLPFCALEDTACAARSRSKRANGLRTKSRTFSGYTTPNALALVKAYSLHRPSRGTTTT
ncbi:hypothetical protein LZ30DRAFT_195661 [Colletotrichum cereale]|nr:hypothetical protein LZ30DRAFT_195661 [Colletotrichum cereale]